MASKVALLALLSTTVSANEEFCPKLCRDCDELGNCLTCKGYNLLQLYDCVESCSVGFFPNGDECHECPWECDSCTSLTECQSCRVDYFHQAGSCVDQCSEGYFLSDNTCEQCSSDCIECYEYQECFRCKSGTLLQNNKCVSSCSNGYSEVSSDLCLPCHTGCATCIGPNQQCTKCETGLYLKGNSCITKSQCEENGQAVDGLCKSKRVTISRNQLLRLSTLIHLPKKTPNYRVVFNRPGHGHLFIATPMDGGWPTYILPDWKQPMALDGDDLLDDVITEIAGNDMDNAWYRPAEDDTDLEVLNYQIYHDDDLIDESQFELEIMEASRGEIRADDNIKMTQIVAPGTSKKLRQLHFSAGDSVTNQEIVYIIISRLPPGFASIQRSGSNEPILEFTQADIDNEQIIIKTTPHWPGHDLSFEFLVQAPEGTTIEPFVFSIKAPKIEVTPSKPYKIEMDELGIEDALFAPNSFLLLKKSPQYGQIKTDGSLLAEEQSAGLDAQLTYELLDTQTSEDVFIISVYWDGKQDDIRVTVDVVELDDKPISKGSLSLSVANRRTQIDNEVLHFAPHTMTGSKKQSVRYFITRDPLWGILEVKLGKNKVYSPLAWGSNFTQGDVDRGLVFYHYYGNSAEEMDNLGLKAQDTVTKSYTEIDLKMKIAIDSMDYNAFSSESSESDAIDSFTSDSSSFYDGQIDLSSTIEKAPLLKVKTNEKYALTPSDLGIVEPHSDDWIEVIKSPSLGELILADSGAEMTPQTLQELIDGKILYKSGDVPGSDQIEFLVYLISGNESEKKLIVNVNIEDDIYVPEMELIDSDSSSAMADLAQALKVDPTVRTELAADDQSAGLGKFPAQPSVKNTIEVEAHKIKIITELATLPNTDQDTKFTITSTPTMGNLKLLTQPGSPIGRVLQHGDEFTRKDVEDGRLCYVGVNGLGISAINVREDSFSYTIGSGNNKRFGEISIRIEDFLLSRTGDPNLPGFEPAGGVGADRLDEEDSIFDPSISQEVPIMTLNKVYCEEGGRTILTSNEISATDQLKSRASTLEFTIDLACRHGAIEIFMNGHGEWVQVDTFTMQDILSNEVSYRHDGSETKSDRCQIFVSNDQGEQSDQQALEISIHSIDDGAPHITINTGLTFLEYGTDGAPMGQITSATLTTVDPDTKDINIIYQVYETPKHGAVINTDLGAAVTQFSQADVNSNKIRYVLERAQTRAESDQFRFTVRDSQQVIEGNVFVIHWSTVEFEQSHMTVAEDEGQVSVMIRRKGYLNHYAIVTCSSLADDQKQQQVQFEPGEEVKPCVVPLNADDAFQGEREVQLELADPTYTLLGQTRSMYLTINDPEDMPTISFLTNEIHIDETAKSLVIPIRREGDASVTATVICYTVTGSASLADFEARDRLENNQLVFMGMPFNERDASCEVNLIDDSLFEQPETFFVKLEKASYNARLGKIDTVKVIIDGPNDLPKIEMADNKINVDESAGIAEVEVLRHGSDLSQKSEVFCYSRESTAETGFDFEQVQQQITFAPDQDRAICTVELIDDQENPVVEGAEDFIVYLSSPVGSVLGAKIETKVTINDVEEDSSKFNFEKAEVAVSESVGIVSVPVVRSGDLSEEASVICRTLQGSANIEEDFMERTNTEMYRISFAPGESKKPCEVIMIDDERHELDETLFLKLSDPRSSSIYPALLGNVHEAKVTITNEEDVPTITFNKGDLSVREPEPGATKVVTVKVLRYGDTSGNSRVRISTRDGSGVSGVDYEPKSEMLRFLPQQAELVYSVTVKCNEKSAWHKSFTLVMGPDEPVNAVLGEHSSMSITVLDKEATGSLVLPAPPRVVSLADYDQLKVTDKATAEPRTGYPLICVSPCDKESPSSGEMESLCTEAGIDNNLVRYAWEIALPDSSNFVRIQDITPWTNPKSKVLDSIYFKPKCRVRCVAQAYSSEGKAGTPLKSLPTPIASEGYCHNPLVSGPRAFQAQNFHTEMEYMEDDNTLRIKVEVPHEDGLLPIISTSRIHNIDFLLRDEVFRQQHLCSNLLTPSEAPETNEGRGFCGNYDKENIPQVPGYNFPHQFDDSLRGEKALALYQYLNLKSCTWTFETFYTMSELAQTCGGKVSKDFEYAQRGKSHVTVKVPFYVSYIYVQAPTGWASLQHQSELKVSFSYSNVMWKTGLQTDTELTGEVLIDRVSIDTYGRLVVEFQSRTHFRGLFVDKHHSIPSETKATFEPPMNVQTNFTLELMWTEETYETPVQHWKAISTYSRKDYTGEYNLNLIPCSVNPTQKYQPAQVPSPAEQTNPLDTTEPAEPSCTAHEPETFKIKIAFQQSNRPVPVVYSLDTHFHITNSKPIFLTDPSEQKLEEIDYKGTFSKGSRIYARVLWDPEQDLKNAYKLQLEKVYLCTGSNGFVPTYDPTGDIYGQGPQYGCIRPLEGKIQHRFLILDRGNRDAENLDFQDIEFDAEFASDNPEYYKLHKMSSADGFSFSVDPLYKVVAGHEWYLQILYIIGGADGRVRREVASIAPIGETRLRRAARENVLNEKEYLKTLFSSHGSQNGTNMHFLALDEVEQGTMGIVAGVIGTLVLVILCVAFVYRKRIECVTSGPDEDLNNQLTHEEEALIAKKLGGGTGSYKPNNLTKTNNYGYNEPKILNNQSYLKSSNTRDDMIIKNHIKTPKRKYSSNQHVKIHNNLHKTGTEI